MSKRTRYARGHYKQISKRQGGLDIDQLTEWHNIKGKRRTHRYNSKRKKQGFFGPTLNFLWGHGHTGRR